MQVYKLWSFDRRPRVLSTTHIIYYTVLADGQARLRKITSNHPTLYNINVRIIRRPLENSPSVWNVSNVLTGRRRRLLPHIIHVPGITLVGRRHCNIYYSPLNTITIKSPILFSDWYVTPSSRTCRLGSTNGKRIRGYYKTYILLLCTRDYKFIKHARNADERVCNFVACSSAADLSTRDTLLDRSIGLYILYTLAHGSIIYCTYNILYIPHTNPPVTFL